VAGALETVILIQGDRLGRGEDLPDPVEVALGPVAALAIGEPAPARELENVVSRLHDLALAGLSAADEIADLLVGLSGDVDENEAVVAIVPGELDGVPTVRLAVLACAAGDELRGRQVADDVPLGEDALEDVPSAGGLIAGAHGAVGLQPLEVAADRLEVVRQPIDA